ncbi:O-antigen ligase family protein [Halostagnicola bangensis]
MRFHRDLDDSQVRSILFLVICFTLFVVPWREAMPTLGPVSIGRVLAVILLGLVLLHAILKGGFEWPTAFLSLFAVFVIWSAISLLWTSDVSRGAVVLARLGLPFVLVLALWETINSQRQLETAIAWLLVGSFVVMGIVFYDFATTSIVDRGTMIFGFNAAVVSRRLVFCVPLAGYLVLRSHRSSLRVLGFVFGILAFAAVTAMVVRQALGTFVIGTGTLVAFEAGRRFVSQEEARMPSKEKATKALAASGVFIGSLLAAGLLIYQQLSSYRASQLFSFDPSLTGRTDIWAAGWDVFQAEANPLLGLGIGAFNSLIGPSSSGVEFAATYLWPHSSLVGITVEMGVIGLVIFIATAFTGLTAFGERSPDLPIAAAATSIWVPLSLVADVYLDVLGWTLLIFIILIACFGPQNRC